MNETVIQRDEFINICNNSSTKQEAQKTLKMHNVTFDKYCKLFGIQKFRRERYKLRYPLDDILNGKYPYYATSQLNKRLIKEGYKEQKCECCGMTEWLGEPIPLELHHIDGNKQNHQLSNLQMLCPNCHSITDNFKSKNIKHYKIT